MKQSKQQLMATWFEDRRRQCFPLRIVELPKSRDSWLFPTPWIDGPEIGPSHWEYCCFRLPTEEPVYVKITTTLVDEYGARNEAGALSYAIHDEGAGYLTTTFHTELPAPGIPAKYGFEIFEPIPDPTGPYDKSDPAWDFHGQWLGHKIGGAPFIHGPDRDELRNLLQNGYELLLMLKEPSYSVDDWKRCDDYSGDWLFGEHRFNVLINPRTMDVRYTWG
ncbi:hypothetical protein EV701_1528 [Chthoniobacter flavus]|uniref:hypothetical protein n=1 Tax=Chthoniobacter flavus TaxID=191863 RepID=UPI0010539F49|nr:hypothetical protein [Chthoniobacter flavus]TCO81867.1 hypothetical protein EV701_1528 [Chthoniobacter flavus]